MNRFVSGSILGFLVGISVAATQAPPKEDPCMGWKFDCAVLEAAVLTLSGGDMEKYSNVLENMGWAAARAVKRAEGVDVGGVNPNMYEWETTKMNAWQRRQHDNARDRVHLEAVILVKEEVERKARQERINNVS